MVVTRWLHGGYTAHAWSTFSSFCVTSTREDICVEISERRNCSSLCPPVVTGASLLRLAAAANFCKRASRTKPYHIRKLVKKGGYRICGHQSASSTWLSLLVAAHGGCKWWLHNEEHEPAQTPACARPASHHTQAAILGRCSLKQPIIKCTLFCTRTSPVLRVGVLPY